MPSISFNNVIGSPYVLGSIAIVIVCAVVVTLIDIRRRQINLRRFVGIAVLAIILITGIIDQAVIVLQVTHPITTMTFPSIGTTLYVYVGHSSMVDTAAWSPDSKRIASGSFDDTVQVWDATTGRNVFTFRGHSDAVSALAWSPDGARIVSGGGKSYNTPDNTVQVWDANTGQHIFTYQTTQGNVRAVAWSPDSKRVASMFESGIVRVWDANTGSHSLTHHSKSSVLGGLTWSPDGSRIASFDGDEAVQVWDAVTGKNIFTYDNHCGRVTTLAWSPDGTHIASAGYEEGVRVWQAIKQHDVSLPYYQQGKNGIMSSFLIFSISLVIVAAVLAVLRYTRKRQARVW